MTAIHTPQAEMEAATDRLRRQPGKAELHPQRTRRRRRRLEIALGIGVPLALVLLWQLASTREWIDSRLYPSPTDIGSEFKTLWQSGALWDAISVSAQRTLIGFVFGAVTGVFAGFAMGGWRIPRAALEPMLLALYTVPKLALLPIFLTIFGFGEMPFYVLIGVTVFFFVWISTMSAVMAVPAGYREAANAFGASRLEMFWHVLLPAALPQIFVGLRIGAAVSVLMLVGVEFVIGNEGLGFLINQGRTLLLLSQSYAGIVVVAAFGFLFATAVRIIGRLLLPWAAEDNSIAPQ